MREKGVKWINVDNYELSGDKSFVKADIVKDIPLENNSVDYIIMDQVLEHIAMADVPLVLYNIRRILKIGGKCIIMVPDFEDAVNQWFRANHNKAFDPMQYKWLSEVIYGNQAHEGEFHKTPMCAGYLHYTLNMVGFPKHTISFWPANGVVPSFPGIRPYPKEARLRNAQLACEITKT